MSPTTTRLPTGSGCGCSGAEPESFIEEIEQAADDFGLTLDVEHGEAVGACDPPRHAQAPAAALLPIVRLAHARR